MAPSHQFLTDLSEDMAELLDTGAGYDVVIQVGEESHVKEFRVHSAILAARCPYFQTALSSRWMRKSGDVFVFRKPNISPSTFKEILKYLYTGAIDLSQKDGTEIIKILVAADELDLQKIVKVVKRYLIDNQSEFLTSSPIRFFQTVFLYDACASLRDYCLQAICENPKIIFGSSDYLLVDKSLLLLVLQREDLEMEEIDIWWCILKWSIAQNSMNLTLNENNMSKNLLQLTDQDFADLREILKDMIPYIRWAHISSSDFLHRVRPFKKLLPETLYEEIMGFYLDSGNKPSNILVAPRKGRYFDSVLLEQDHVGILASWIDDEVMYYDKNNNPYSFKLLLRASRDGFDPNTFHQLCDHKGATIMVAKLVASGQLVGGYNPLYWSSHVSSEEVGASNFDTANSNSGNWWETNDSFLFSFHNKDYKIARVQNPRHAIYYNRKYGPGWGYTGDLIIKDSGSIYNSQKLMTYPDAVKFFPHPTSTEYDIEDYEVFQINRKPGYSRKKNPASYLSKGLIRWARRQDWINIFWMVLQVIAMIAVMVAIVMIFFVTIKHYNVHLKVMKFGQWLLANSYRSLNKYSSRITASFNRYRNRDGL
ncbi:6190_t:CDS:2 [Acaulospora morrowiae]|uniref:6190_t:CDS:1 n=1 Tax=Acaulospora morrowiae TaxID=94023 RepID=A0A9N8YSI4_9GLOM|nr:6190_t:CDS:2 [Acaulospora morrowiae]